MDFNKIKDIIEFAVAKEQEAVNFYTELAGKVSNKAVAAELMDMAAMEERHRDWLKENSVSLATSTCAVPVANLQIADYTVEPHVGKDLTWQDVVNLAMHREASAMELYNNLEQLVTETSAKQMFQQLAAEESRHKLYFESIWDDEVLIEN